jgi:hypothetical protein
VQQNPDGNQFCYLGGQQVVCSKITPTNRLCTFPSQLPNACFDSQDATYSSASSNCRMNGSDDFKILVTGLPPGENCPWMYCCYQ